MAVAKSHGQVPRKIARDCGLSYVRYDADFPSEKSNVMVKDWRRRTHRDEFRQSDAMTQIMKEVIFLPDSDSPGNHHSSPNDKALLIYRFMTTSRKFIQDCFSKSSRPDMVYEVWTVYFPAEDIVAMLDSDPLYRFPRMVNYRSLTCGQSDPIGAVLSQIIAFVSGEVEYKRRRCKRIAWFMNWKSREEEEIYKETVFSRENNGEWRTVVGLFIEELQGLGMVGYESCHARFFSIESNK